MYSNRTYGSILVYQFNQQQHMDYNDYPTTPYSPSEQQRIMQDLEQSKRVAVEEHDDLRSFYLNEITTNNND